MEGNSLVVQWLGLSSLTAKGPSSIPGRGTKSPPAAGYSQFFFFSRVWKTKGIRITKTPFKEKNQFGRRGLADSKTYHMGPPWRSSG